MGDILMISSLSITFLDISSFWSTTCLSVKSVWTSSGVRFLTSTLYCTITSKTNVWEGRILVPPSKYSVRIFLQWERFGHSLLFIDPFNRLPSLFGYLVTKWLPWRGCPPCSDLVDHCLACWGSWRRLLNFSVVFLVIFFSFQFPPPPLVLVSPLTVSC